MCNRKTFASKGCITSQKLYKNLRRTSVKGSLSSFEQFPVRRDIVCVSSSFIFLGGEGMAEVSKRSPVNKRSNTKITLTPPPSPCVYFFTKSSCKIWPLSPRSFLLRYGISHRKVFIHQLASPQGKRRRRAKRRFPYVSHRFSDAQKKLPKLLRSSLLLRGNTVDCRGRRRREFLDNLWEEMHVYFLFIWIPASPWCKIYKKGPCPNFPTAPLPPPVLHSRKAR